jgi:3-phenylpropionate/trans-cinnamate dioxygenase ferredoxin subunit
MAEFLPVGRVEDLPPGTMRAFQVGGEDVAVANVDGELHAFGDECTHQRCSLTDGDLEGVSVICPCHGSEFDVRTGEVLSPPATQPVPTFEVRAADGEIQVAP